MTRAFGIEATTDLALAGEVASAAEALGYRAVWTNDSPSGAEGLAVAAAFAAATRRVAIGVGVLPVDSRSPEEISRRVAELGLPMDRLLLGLGSGFSPRPVGAVREAVARLRGLLPEAVIGVAAMGPRMCRLAGEIADFALLNWMTPARIDWATRLIAPKQGRPTVAAYVRAAVGSDAADRIAAEASRYAALPHYRRHFEAMAADGVVGVAFNTDPTATQPSGSMELDRYDEVLESTVVRALTRTGRVDEIVEISQLAALSN